MIAHLDGIIAEKSLYGLVVEVSGVGFGVSVSATTLSKLPRQGEPCFVYIHTNVHERGIDLYGFFDLLERQVFRLLIGISGIGPRVALGILSAVDVPELMEAIGGEDVKRLTRIPGIGKKTAQRLIVELQEKFSKMAMEKGLDSMKPGGGGDALRHGKNVVGDGKAADRIQLYRSVSSALCNMGYKSVQVDKTVQELKKQDKSNEMTLEKALKTALKLLHRPSR